MTTTRTAPRTATRTERWQRRLRAAMLTVSLCLVAGLAFVWWSNANRDGPEDEARAYLDAVSAGDVEEVLERSAVPPGDRDSAVTSAVYAAAEDRISGYDVTGVEVAGDLATVTVRLDGPAEVVGSGEVELTLEREGARLLVLDNWVVAHAGLAARVELPVPEGSGSVSVNGVEVDTAGAVGSVDYWALPGSYAIDAYAGNEWLDAAATTTLVPADQGSVRVDVPEPQPSEAFWAELEAAYADWLEAEAAPEVRWTVTPWPELSVNEETAWFPLHLSGRSRGGTTLAEARLVDGTLAFRFSRP